MERGKKSLTTLKTTKSGGAIVPAFSFAPHGGASARVEAEHFEIAGATFAAYYDAAHKLIFVVDTTADPRTPNTMLVINPDSNDPSRKWDDILDNDYGVNPETVRPRKNNKYQKLDIEYAGLGIYNRLINAHASGKAAELDTAMAALDEFRNGAAMRSANMRLNAARSEMRTASETLDAATESIADARAQIKKERDKVTKLRAEVGKKPTKESAAKILRAESRADAANEKLKRTDARVKRARKRLRDAKIDAAAAERQLAALKTQSMEHRDFVEPRPSAPVKQLAVQPVKKNQRVVTPATGVPAKSQISRGGMAGAISTVTPTKKVESHGTEIVQSSETKPSVRKEIKSSETTLPSPIVEVESKEPAQSIDIKSSAAESPVAESTRSEPTPEIENVAPPAPSVTAAPEIILKVPETKAKSMSEEVQPLFSKDPKVIDDGIAFKPIEFGTPRPTPAQAVDFTPPTFGGPGASEKSQDFVGWKSAPDTLSAAELAAVPPVAEVAPVESVAPVPPVTNNAAPTRPIPLMTEAQADPSARAYPTESTIPLGPGGAAAAGVPMAAYPLERPASPVGAEEIPIQIERKRPSAIYYVMLAILIALSVMTLWLYQHRMSDTLPDLKAAATTAQPAASSPQNQVINDNPNAYAADNAPSAPTPKSTAAADLSPEAQALGDDGNPFLDNGPVAPSDNKVPETGIALPLAQAAATALSQPTPSPVPAPAAADDTIALPLQNNSGAALSNDMTQPAPVGSAIPAPVANTNAATTDTNVAMCPGTQIPADADGCCPGEALTNLGGASYCCPAAGGNCYPPLKNTAAQTAAAVLALSAASVPSAAGIAAASASAPAANQNTSAAPVASTDTDAMELCPDTNTPPNADGCCTGETLTDMGDQGMNCCDAAKGECFPPMK